MASVRRLVGCRWRDSQCNRRPVASPRLSRRAADDFAAGYGHQVLIRARVHAALEEMHRAVAEQEIASTWVHAPKRIGVEERVVAVGLVRGVAVAEAQGFVEVRIVVGGAISGILGTRREEYWGLSRVW